jgi:hypothetical protein
LECHQATRALLGRHHRTNSASVGELQRGRSHAQRGGSCPRRAGAEAGRGRTGPTSGQGRPARGRANSGIQALTVADSHSLDDTEVMPWPAPRHGSSDRTRTPSTNRHLAPAALTGRRCGWSTRCCGSPAPAPAPARRAGPQDLRAVEMDATSRSTRPTERRSRAGCSATPGSRGYYPVRHEADAARLRVAGLPDLRAWRDQAGANHHVRGTTIMSATDCVEIGIDAAAERALGRLRTSTRCGSARMSVVWTRRSCRSSPAGARVRPPAVLRFIERGPRPGGRHGGRRVLAAV